MILLKSIECKKLIDVAFKKNSMIFDEDYYQLFMFLALEKLDYSELFIYEENFRLDLNYVRISKKAAIKIKEKLKSGLRTKNHTKDEVKAIDNIIDLYIMPNIDPNLVGYKVSFYLEALSLE